MVKTRCETGNALHYTGKKAQTPHSKRYSKSSKTPLSFKKKKKILFIYF